MNVANTCSSARPKRLRPLLPVLAAAAFFLATAVAQAQVPESGDQGGTVVTVGAIASASTLEYGNRKMIGITGFIDADTHRRFGFEAEGRWLEWHQTTDVHAETYSIGGRYHFDLGRRWEPYAKGLVGFGDFNFPYNLATGSYLVVTGGAGLDIRLTRRIYLRAADFEYQDWPQFTYGGMTSAAVSSGIKIRIF